MKPKNLKFPFTWEERRPLFLDRVLFVPQYYDRHHEWKFPGWDHKDFFGKKGKVYVEYCAGNGAWIVDKASQFPDIHWVAVEKKFERVRKIWSKMQNDHLTNLIIVSGEALTFTQQYLPDHCVDGIYVNFPDPWPKEKHAKHRLIQESFVKEITRVVKDSGFATYVTDARVYSEQMIQEMLQNSSWRSHFPSPYFVTEWIDYGVSYFGDLWREKGRTIYYMQFLKT